MSPYCTGHDAAWVSTAHLELIYGTGRKPRKPEGGVGNM